MNWNLLLNLLSVFHILNLSQSSYVQNAKQRIRADIGGLIENSGRQRQFVPHDYEHFHENGRRVHQVHGGHRNRWSSGHRKSMEHHHFTGWSAWSVCSTECIKRRERYCKLKRKCGLTKHVEERKCLHCIPSFFWKQQAKQYIDDKYSNHQKQQQQQNQQQQTIHNGAVLPPSIIINAAAAASGPMHQQYLLPTKPPSTTSPPPPPPPSPPIPSSSSLLPHTTVVHHQIRLPVLQEIVSHPQYSSHHYQNDLDDLDYRYENKEEEEYLPENSFEPESDILENNEELVSPFIEPNSLENENTENYYRHADQRQNQYQDHDQYHDQDDYYVLNTKPRYRRQRQRAPSLIDSFEYSDLEAKNEDEESEDVDNMHSQYSSEEYKHDGEDCNMTPYGVIHSLRKHHKNKKNSKRHKGRQRQLRKSIKLKNPRKNLRNLTPNTDEGIEGDTFQYEDFDFDPITPTSNTGVDNSRSYSYTGNSMLENQSGDSYEDIDYDDIAVNRNSTFLLQSKEKATPDALIPRHRRVYSKWSRWTKCSPKCTTRRYKKCRVREQCGREVLREIAYCYTEGSFCQQWLQAQVQKSSPYEVRPMMAMASRRRDISTDTGGAQSNSIVGDYIMNSKGYRGPEYTPMKLMCGIAPMRNGNGNGKRSMYNMLKIIGGKASRKGEWPWQVAIFNRFKEAFCGGTLIAPQWVLTAAHCVRKVLYVRIGEHNLDYEDGTEMQLRVLKSFKHPNFDKKTVDSDVALLRLPKPVNTTTWIGFSCLPRPYQPLPKNVDCTVIGWGKRRNRDAAGTSVLHQAEVPIISMDNCRSVYQDYTITKNMFCAGHKRGRVDTCAGDSGGPLLCRDTTKPNHPWTIFGITSFGDGCAKRNKFGIYAKVPNYVDWVWSVINCNGNCKLHQRN